jgi:hypothetical protein
MGQKGAVPDPLERRMAADRRPLFTVDHPNELIGRIDLMRAVGTTDDDFFGGLMSQLINASGKTSETDANFLLSVIKGIEPRDQVEAMLAAQMGAIHNGALARERLAITLLGRDKIAKISDRITNEAIEVAADIGVSPRIFIIARPSLKRRSLEPSEQPRSKSAPG